VATTGRVTLRDVGTGAGAGADTVDSGFEGRKVTCAGNW
jgi:hypothetical protein